MIRGRRHTYPLGYRARPGSIAAVSPILFLAACGLSTQHPLPPDGSEQLADFPGGNVLIVIADDLGLEHVGAYAEGGRTRTFTPEIDKLAATGRRYDAAYSSPVCSPTRANLLTGRMGLRYGIGAGIRADDRTELPLAELTLPEMLDYSPRTYATGHVGKWHLASPKSPSGKDHPIAQGFDWFAGTVGNLGAPGYLPIGRDRGYYNWEKITDGAPVIVDRYATTETVDDALSRIREMPEPWFLQVAFNAPHAPWDAPPDDLHRFRLSDDASDEMLYLATVQALDTELGRMLNSMDPQVRDRTTIILIGDNGTPDNRASVNTGKLTLQQSGIHVPLIVAGPQVREPGMSYAGLVHSVDVFATVAEIAGVDIGKLRRKSRWGAPQAIPFDSVSFAGSLGDPDAPAMREHVYTDIFCNNHASCAETELRATILDREYKLVHRRNRTTFSRLDSEGVSERIDLETGSEADLAAYERFAATLERTVSRLKRDQ